MQSFQLYALAGALSLGTLTILYSVLWRDQRQYWAGCFALTFLLHTLRYALPYARPVDGQASTVSHLLTFPALVAMSYGMIDYVGLGGRPKQVLQWLALGGGALAPLIGLSSGLSARGASLHFASFVTCWALLALWAATQERRAGHALVFASLIPFPVFVAASQVGWLDPLLLRYLAAIPTSVAGITLLTTGLMRAQHLTQEALRRREQVELALRELNATLEQRVAQRTADLHQMVAGLESFNRSVSHDLRGPLGGIAGVARMALAALARQDQTTAARGLSAIAAQADSSTNLVAALLALARAGDTPLVTRPIKLAELVPTILERIRHEDPEAKMLPVRIQGSLPEVHADPDLLGQVYINLIANAIKFSRSQPHPEVEVGAMSAGPETVLYVRDNGVGFDPTKAVQLFEPFDRLHGQRFEGHGVGLSIVKRIIERHGGRVWVQSSEGAGATFMFTLAPAPH
ncbi:MAG: hypothetical protein KGL90_05950 [Burkholderiales bacterium]|nr:hypothetical protein [Burkholderiales bacterium]